MVNEVIDMDLYVGTKNIKLFGRTHQMKRLSNREYFEMNQLGVRFDNGVTRVRNEAVQKMADKLKSKYEKIETETEDEEEQKELKLKERLSMDMELEDIIRKKMDKLIIEHEKEVQNCIKTLIPTLSDDELSQTTMALFNALLLEIEIQKYIDRYYTREEAIQKIKESDEADFRMTQQTQEQTEPPAG